MSKRREKNHLQTERTPIVRHVNGKNSHPDCVGLKLLDLPAICQEAIQGQQSNLMANPSILRRAKAMSVNDQNRKRNQQEHEERFLRV